jgi:hypothetical protein
MVRNVSIQLAIVIMYIVLVALIVVLIVPGVLTAILALAVTGVTEVIDFLKRKKNGREKNYSFSNS